MSLAGRVALVTGASQGIGRACAMRLAKEGATVAVAARNQGKLDELVSFSGEVDLKACCRNDLVYYKAYCCIFSSNTIVIFINVNLS